MNAKMNRLLENLHTKLSRQEGRTKAPVRRVMESAQPRRRRHVREDEAFGPTFSQDQVGDDKSHLSSRAGVGGATNIPDHNDVFDKYMSTCMDALKHGMGWEDGKANSFINKVAGEMASEGLLPDMPSEGGENEAEDLALWMAAAHSVAFIAELLQRARASE